MGAMVNKGKAEEKKGEEQEAKGGKEEEQGEAEVKKGVAKVMQGQHEEKDAKKEIVKAGGQPRLPHPITPQKKQPVFQQPHLQGGLTPAGKGLMMGAARKTKQPKARQLLERAA